MGLKKVSPTSLKISKNDNKKPFNNSLLKVLRPKVYIIDSSSFKRLVQELTGNGTTAPISSPPPPPPPSPPPFKPHTVVDIEVLGELTESSTETKFDHSSVDSLEFSSQELDQYFNHTCFDDITSSDDVLSMSQEAADMSYQDLEPLLLLDVEESQYPLCMSSYSQIDQEEGMISIYDYELSGLL